MSLRTTWLRFSGYSCLILLALCTVLARQQGVWAAREPRLLEGIARLAIPAVLSYVLEVKTTVDEVKIDLEGGSLIAKNLQIGNPRGYGDKPAFVFDQIRVEADIQSLYTETPVIHRIEVTGAKARVSTNRHGNNIKRMIDSANRWKDPRQEKKEPNAQTKWRIERAVMNQCAVDIVTDLGLKETQHKELNPIDLDLKGPDGTGLAADEALSKVLDAILAKIQLDSIMGLPLPKDLLKLR